MIGGNHIIFQIDITDCTRVCLNWLKFNVSLDSFQWNHSKFCWNIPDAVDWIGEIFASPIVEHLRMILDSFVWSAFYVDHWTLFFPPLSGPSWIWCIEKNRIVLGIFVFGLMHGFQQRKFFLPCPNLPTNPVFPGICGNPNQNVSILVFIQLQKKYFKLKAVYRVLIRICCNWFGSNWRGFVRCQCMIYFWWCHLMWRLDDRIIWRGRTFSAYRQMFV